MAGLAIVALALAGWRKTARATPPAPRGTPILRRPRQGIPIAETTTPLYRRPSVVRRIWAAAASSALAVLIGAVLAVVLAFGLGYLVITLTDLLKQ